MKKLNKLGTVLCAALFGSLAMAEEAAAPSKHSLKYSLDASRQNDGNNFDGEHNLDYSYKVNDDYTLKAQLDFHTTRAKDDKTKEWDNTVTHEYFRMSIFGPTFAEVMGYKAQWAVRYFLPTDHKRQEAGGYGRVSPRIYFTKEYSPFFNLTVVPILNVELNRNYKQVHNAARGLNEAGATLLEVVPQFVFMKNLTLTLDVTVGAIYTGYEFDHIDGLYDADYELNYNIESLGNLGVALFSGNTFKFGNSNKAKFYKDSESKVGIRIQKGFSL